MPALPAAPQIAPPVAPKAVAPEAELLHRLFDSLPVLVAYMDADFTFLKVNRLYAEADGRDEGFFPGRNHFDLYPNAENERIFRRVVETGEPYRAYARPFEYADHPERGVSYWDWIVQPVREPDGGRVGGVVFSLIDVTARVRAERATAEAAALYEAERRAADGRLRRLLRAHRALSGCNQTIIHAVEEGALLRDMCRVLVEAGGYPQVCVATDGEALPIERDALVCWGERPAEAADAVVAWEQREGLPLLKGRPLRLAHLTGADGAPAGAAAALPLAGERGELFGHLFIWGLADDGFTPEELDLLSELAADLAFGLSVLRLRADQQRSAERQELALEQTIQAIAATVEMRDPYTAGHQRRVAELAGAIAEALGLPDEEVKGIVMAGAVHDIGKVCVPAEILTRSGRLTTAEYRLIQSHSEAGWEILKPVDAPWPLADLVRQHHERWNGTGYPQGLSGEEILLGARIIAVADVVEAMACHRPYRAALGIDAALREIAGNRGTLYDARVVDACLTVFREGRVTL
ncbi:MAG TPA: HD domain-containing phosphohydrolase [Azospirillum sp.]